MTDLEDICFWHKIAEEEKELNDMPKVIKAYEKMGCYSCSEYEKKCNFYKGIEQEYTDGGI